MKFAALEMLSLQSEERRFDAESRQSAAFCAVDVKLEEDEKEHKDVYILPPIDEDLEDFHIDSSRQQQRRTKYPLELKLEAIEYAKSTSNREASRMYQCDRKMIRDWRKNEVKIREAVDSKKCGFRLPGGGCGGSGGGGSGAAKEAVQRAKALALINSIKEGPAKRERYSLEMKIQAINYAKMTSNKEASRLYQCDPKRIREWRQNEDKFRKAIDGSVKDSFRLPGGGRKVTSSCLNHLALDEQRSSNKELSGAIIKSEANTTNERIEDTSSGELRMV